jgi:hypothetical protein
MTSVEGIPTTTLHPWGRIRTAPRDPRLTVLEDGLPCPAARQAIGVARQLCHVAQEVERRLTRDDEAAIGHQGGNRPGSRWLGWGQELLDTLQAEVEREDTPELSLGSAYRRANAHHHFRPGPPGHPHERLRRGRRPLEPLLIPHGQALALGQGRYRADGDAQIIEQDGPLDVREGLLQPASLGLGRSGAGTGRPQEPRSPGDGLDPPAEVLVHLRAQEARLGECIPLHPIPRSWLTWPQAR